MVRDSKLRLPNGGFHFSEDSIRIMYSFIMVRFMTYYYTSAWKKVITLTRTPINKVTFFGLWVIFGA